MKTNIIGVKYEDNLVPNTFSGKSYSYYSNIDVNVGDLVIAPTSYGEKIARVSEVDIPDYKIENIRPCLKTIAHRIDKIQYLATRLILKEVA